MSSGEVENEGISKPARSSCHDLQTSMNKETGLFQPNNPHIEDPGRGLDDPSLTKGGIAGDLIGNNTTPGKEEEMQSATDAEIILDENKLSDGKNLHPQTIQPPPGEKPQVDDRATRKKGQVDEEEISDKSLLPECHDNVATINVALSSLTEPNSAATDEGEEVLNDHFREENGVYLESLENGVTPSPTICSVIESSDINNANIYSVQNEVIALHDTTKFEGTLDEKEVTVDEPITNGSPHEIGDGRKVLPNKEEPSGATDNNFITAYHQHPKDSDETTSGNIANLIKLDHNLNSCNDNTRVLKNGPIHEVEEEGGNNTAVVSATEVGVKDIMLLEEEEDGHLSEREEEVMQSSMDNCSHLNPNTRVNCSRSNIGDKSMLEGNESNNKISKQEDEPMLDGQGLKNYIYGGGNGHLGDVPPPHKLELSKQQRINDDDETTIKSESSCDDIGGIDSDFHNLELIHRETKNIKDNILLEKHHDQLGLQNEAVVTSSHSLSPPSHRSEEERKHEDCRKTIKMPALTLEDVFQRTGTVTTPQSINDVSDKFILTPRSAKACAINGVNPVLLLKRNIESFAGADVDPSIKKLKCEMYNRRRYQLMKICCNEKDRLDSEAAKANAVLHRGGGRKGQPKSQQQQHFKKGRINTLSMIEHENQKIENIKRQRLKEAEQQLALEMKRNEMEKKIREREEKEELYVAKVKREKQRRQREIAEERRMKEIAKITEAAMEAARQQLLLREEHERSFQLAQTKLKEEKKAKEEARLREKKAMESRERFKMQTQLFFEENQRKALASEAERKEKEELRKKRVAKQCKAALDAISVKQNQRKKRMEMNLKHIEVSARALL